MSAEPLPDWFFPPPGGWTAEDLDRLPPAAPRRVELIDGALVVRSPQTIFHSLVTHTLTSRLREAAPDGFGAAPEMTVRIGERQRPEPDIVVYRKDPDAPVQGRRTSFRPEEVALVVEVVSEESQERDRTTKPLKYAEAGIPHFWRIEEEKGHPVVHVYELDVTTGVYVATGIVRDQLKLAVPFTLDIDVKALYS